MAYSMTARAPSESSEHSHPIGGVVAANTYNDGSVGVDFQAYDSPDQAVAAAMKASGSGVVTAEAVMEAPGPAA